MKKYYGPIVMGLAALTMAAPAVNATTVLAAEGEALSGDVSEGDGTTTTPNKGEETTTEPGDGEEVVTPGEDDKGENETPTVTDAQKELNDKIDSIDALIASGNYKPEQVTTLNNLKADYTQKAAAAKDDQTREDLLADLNSDLKDVGYTITTPTTGIVTATQEKVTLPKVETVVVKAGKSEDIYVHTPSGYKQTNGLNISVDKDGNVSISGLDKDGNVPLTDTVTADSLKENIDFHITLIKDFTSPDKKDELAKLVDDYTKALTDIKNNIPTEKADAKTLHDLNNQIENVNKEYTNQIDLGGNRAEGFVPILKGGSVTFHGAGKEYDTVKYNEEGNGLVSAEVTDKDGNKIKSNTKLNAQIEGSSVSVKNTNEPLPSSGHSTNTVKPNNNNNKPSTNTETKHTKSISNHPATFYALPNSVVTLFDVNGDQVKGRALNGNSSWRADKLMSLDGINYLRVSTNEWAKLADGLEVTPLSQNIYTKNEARLYTGNGNLVAGRALSKNTSWFTDKSATINGQTMYRVSTNEWVGANDIK